jgi:hypothetical protein
LRLPVGSTPEHAGKIGHGAAIGTLALAHPRSGGIGSASFLADVGHEIPTALLASFVTATLGAPAAALGLIEGISDGLAGAGRFAGGALSDDPGRRRTLAVGGYSATATLSALIGVTGSTVQVGVLRGAAWAARGLRVPARNALLADVVPAGAYGRAYGFERTMDNLGAIVGPLLALGLVSLFSVRTAILISAIPGVLAALAIVYAIKQAKLPRITEKRKLRFQIRPVLRGQLGRIMVGFTAFELGNVAATLLILRATRRSRGLRPSRDPRVRLWAPCDRASRWQRGRQRRRGPSLHRGVADNSVRLPHRVHGDRARRARMGIPVRHRRVTIRCLKDSAKRRPTRTARYVQPCYA